MSSSLQTVVIPAIEFLFRHVARRWTKRDAKLGPLHVVISLMFMGVLGSKGYKRTLEEMQRHLGRSLGWLEDDRPSTSALAQARPKLHPDQLRRMFAEVVELCEAAHAKPDLGYRGFRLISCDGTSVALPARRKLLDHFGGAKNQTGKCLTPMCGLVVLWDMGRRMPVDYRVTSYPIDERAALVEMIPALRQGDLVLSDRGLFSRDGLAKIKENGADFLFRVQRNACKEVREFIVRGSSDEIVDLPVGSGSIRVRLLRIQHPKAEQPRILITSLIDPIHRPEDLNDLYSERWRVETGFREMKVWHGLESIHGRSVTGVHQEIAALMIFLVLAAELEARARQHHAEEIAQQPTVEGRRSLPDSAIEDIPIRFNRAFLTDFVVWFIIDAASDDPEAIRTTFRRCMKALWESRQRYRPRRSFPREAKSTHAKQKHIAARKRLKRRKEA